jgi:hypothetical protein
MHGMPTAWKMVKKTKKSVPDFGKAARQRGCQMVYFHTKNPIFEYFRRFLSAQIDITYMATWSIL